MSQNQSDCGEAEERRGAPAAGDSGTYKGANTH